MSVLEAAGFGTYEDSCDLSYYCMGVIPLLSQEDVLVFARAKEGPGSLYGGFVSGFYIRLL